MDRVIEHLDAQAGSGKPLAETIEGLVGELESWTGGAEQEDDISMLVVRRGI